MRQNYETDNVSFPDDARYTIAGHSGVAWYAWGWETEPDEDTEWSGYEVRTGQIGDDRQFAIDANDLTPISDGEYCSECGQVGCQGG